MNKRRDKNLNKKIRKTFPKTFEDIKEREKKVSDKTYKKFLDEREQISRRIIQKCEEAIKIGEDGLKEHDIFLREYLKKHPELSNKLRKIIGSLDIEKKQEYKSFAEQKKELNEICDRIKKTIED